MGRKSINFTQLNGMRPGREFFFLFFGALSCQRDGFGSRANMDQGGESSLDVLLYGSFYWAGVSTCKIPNSRSGWKVGFGPVFPLLCYLHINTNGRMMHI